jgi:hypothetical protein
VSDEPLKKKLRPPNYADKLALEIARARIASHVGHESSRYCGDPLELAYVGALGELTVARAFGIPYDLKAATEQVGGDGGVDFAVWIKGKRVTMNVKTARGIAVHLCIKPADIKTCADLLVLARWNKDIVTLMGWETKSMMALAPVVDFGYGVPCHARAPELLRPICQLADFLSMRETILVRPE